MIFLYGKETLAAAGVLSAEKQFFHTCDIDELINALDACVQKDDLVLLKGSRGCALEKLNTVFLGAASPEETASPKETCNV